MYRESNRRLVMEEARCLRMLELRTLTDTDLVALARDGDPEAFGELVARYQNKIHQLARRLTYTQEDAEDVLQEAFIRAFRAIAGFKGDSKFSTWLYRITVNLAAMERRARKTKLESLDEPISTEDSEIRRELKDPSVDPLAALLAKETGESLGRAISSLSPTNRAVFVLRHIEGLSTEETRDVLRISASAVKSRLHRTRLVLQRQLVGFAQEKSGAPCTTA
jgi:RNA polymerase sigma-70 factor (ECF subfamily)